MKIIHTYKFEIYKFEIEWPLLINVNNLWFIYKISTGVKDSF